MAIITNMDMPLGNNIGNSLEVIEAIEILKGKGPKDLKELCIELATNMLELATNKSNKECKKEVIEVINNGKALNKLKELIIAQKGNPDVIDNYNLFPTSTHIIEVKSNKSGYITKMDTALIGKVSSLLGAGRTKKEDSICYEAGIIVKAKINDFVKKGDVIAILHTNNKDIINEATNLYLDSIIIGQIKIKNQKLIYDKIK